MGIFSFESFALFCIFVALAAFLVWRQMRDAAEPLEDSRDRREEDAKVTEDFRSALAHYNDTEHEQSCANMEPFGGEGKKKRKFMQSSGPSDYDPYGLTPKQEFLAKAEAERQARSRQAIRRAQEAARNSTVRHFAEDLSKRDDEMAKVINGIQRRVLDEQRAALDRIAGKKP